MIRATAEQMASRCASAATPWHYREKVLALGEVGTESAIATLVGAKHDQDDLIRFKVIQGLERTRNPSAIRHVEDLLGDEDRYTRARAIHALGNLGSAASLPTIEELLQRNDSDDFIRIACLTSLGNLGGTKAIQILQRYQTSTPIGALPSCLKSVKISCLPRQPQPSILCCNESDAEGLNRRRFRMRG
jgi:HEAT repeat protein